MRCLQAPLSLEAKHLPDQDTLQDRMSVVAYEAGLSKGADSSAAALGNYVLDVSRPKLRTCCGWLTRVEGDD